MNVDRCPYAHISRLLATRIQSDDDLCALARRGVSVRAYRALADALPLPTRLVGAVLRRQHDTHGLRLSPLESEVAICLARSYARVLCHFDDELHAMRWFTTPAPLLLNRAPISPLELAVTEAGARIVDARLASQKRTCAPSLVAIL